MELDDRKIKILKAIIKNYMESGEPVGSRTISKLPNLSLSSATIRNEMSDLEDMGYIIQPHTSAGRIPTDKGYRFYVDEILRDKQIEVAQLKSDMTKRVDKLEVILKQLAKIIATNTNYAAMISGPNYHQNKIKFIQISRIDFQKVLVVTVVEGNIIKNKIVNLNREISDKDIFNLNLLINTSLNGLAIEEINLNIISKLKKDASSLSDIVDIILTQMAEDFTNEANDLQIYTSGTTNIFKYPELSDGEHASMLLDAFEEKVKLKKIFDDVNASESENGIQVYIGEELPIQNMKNCSVVTANYELGQGIRGTIGIVGPKRMDYEKVLKTIQTVMSQIDEHLNRDD